MPSDWNWTILTQECCISGAFPRSKGPALPLGTLLTQCASGTNHVYTMETACNPTEHFTLSWPARKRSLIRSRKGEKRTQYANSGSKAEKERDTVLQAAKAQSWTRGYRRFPVVTVAHKASSRQAMTSGTAPAVPLERTNAEMGMVLVGSLPRRSWMQVDQAVMVREENSMCQ